MEWVLRKKEITDVLVRSAMSLYEVAKTSVGVNSELSEEFEVNVWMHHGSVLSPFLLQWWLMLSLHLLEGALSELLYADDLILIIEKIKGLWNKFLKWKVVFESKGLKVNFGKTKVCGGITKDDMSNNKVDPCGVISLRAKANSLL